MFNSKHIELSFDVFLNHFAIIEIRPVESLVLIIYCNTLL